MLIRLRACAAAPLPPALHRPSLRQLLTPLIAQVFCVNTLGQLCSSGQRSDAGEQPLHCEQRASHYKMAEPAPVVIPPTKEHTASVIFLHGLGDTGNGWSPVFQNMARSPQIKYICPHAPTRPVTINMGMQMPAWFDIKGLSITAEEDAEGIKQSAKRVHEMIEAEVASGVPSDRILIGGFSMGGALALYSAFTYDKPLAGVVALSAFLIQRDEIQKANGPNRQIQIFQAHGDVDPLVALPFAQATHQLIKSFNPNANFKLYSGMGHSACDAELKDVKEFLEKQLPNK